MTDAYKPTEDDIQQCPNGCPKSDIELGKDQSSFMAVLGSPYMYIRCGQCGFGDDNKAHVELDLRKAVDRWNDTVSASSESEQKE